MSNVFLSCICRVKSLQFDFVWLVKNVFSKCCFKDYLDDHKLRLWDFFRNIDKDGTMRVPVADFRRAMQVRESVVLQGAFY